MSTPFRDESPFNFRLVAPDPIVVARATLVSALHGLAHWYETSDVVKPRTRATIVLDLTLACLDDDDPLTVLRIWHDLHKMGAIVLNAHRRDKQDGNTIITLSMGFGNVLDEIRQRCDHQVHIVLPPLDLQDMARRVWTDSQAGDDIELSRALTVFLNLLLDELRADPVEFGATIDVIAHHMRTAQSEENP